MLTQLSIKNYALIDDLNVSFGEGFTTITGETGAGKSILLGALALVLGKRADLSALKSKETKCVIEAEFAIGQYQLQPFFAAHDLDFEYSSLLRREILPSGKSRAFVNDSPVTLDVLSKLGEQLVDVHSQHQTLRLTEHDFQLKVLDALANNRSLLMEFQQDLKAYREGEKEVRDLQDFQENATKELDYNSFLLKELEEAPLQAGIQEELEEEYEQLNNVETILEQLGASHQILNEETIGVQTQIQALKQALSRLLSFGKHYVNLNERIDSVAIELQDIANELESLNDNIEADPQRFEEVGDQLQLLHNLMKKHQVATVEELMAIREELAVKVDRAVTIESKIAAKQALLLEKEAKLDGLAIKIREKRNKVIPKLKNTLQERLATLGMASASFAIELQDLAEFKVHGKDELGFLFSANKGSDYGPLKKVASGGELSRIMLVIKSILAEYDRLPTLMFDEIDTGVSGEISTKMGSIMKLMGQHMQVFAITHLPQVAAQGNAQFKVYKEEVEDATFTRMRPLDHEERVAELAEMLGGKNKSEAVLLHARELLGV